MVTLPPLVVDLDGTLLRSDLLAESALGYIRTRPFKCFNLMAWLLSGKAYLKDRISQQVPIDVDKLPYNTAVIAFIEEERKKGRRIVLATATHKRYADQIAQHLGLFDEVLATEGDINLSAHRKHDRLIAEYGLENFDYMGNAPDDLEVWKAARKVYVVDPECGVMRGVNKLKKEVHVIQTPHNAIKSWLKALRLHQWVKNLLIFVPLLASHRLSEMPLLWNGCLAFLFFGLCASSVYVLNDLLDLEDDRHHSHKRHRPLASGAISIKSGIMLWPLLLITAFAGALWLLPLSFAATMAAYYALTLAYSLLLKRRMAIDVITLAGLYTIRIIAGTFALGVHLTFWMLAFSMFTFLSLALVKRYAELREAKIQGKTEKTRGRGYYPDDLEMLSSLGAASGYLSVMVLALYIQDKGTMSLYQHPELIWMACPLLLFWFTRIWLITHRGMMHEDPVVFAVKDRVSLAVAVLFGLTFWLAI